MTKTPIEPGDIRKGDLIRAEYMIDGEPEAHEHVANCDGDIWGRVGGTTYFLLDRPKPPVVLPVEVGAYSDNGGDIWVIGDSGLLVCVATWDEGSFLGALKAFRDKGFNPVNYAPFTKLEPVAETAKRFVAAYRAYSSGTNRTVKQLDQAVERVARNEFGVTR